MVIVGSVGNGGQSQSLEPWYTWNNTGTSATKNNITVINSFDDLGLGLLATGFAQINREFYDAHRRPVTPC
jgi:hypothetical protein